MDFDWFNTLLSHEIRFDPAILWMGILPAVILTGLLAAFLEAFVCPVWNFVVKMPYRTVAAVRALVKFLKKALWSLMTPGEQIVRKRVNTRSRKNSSTAAPTLHAALSLLCFCKEALFSLLCYTKEAIKRAFLSILHTAKHAFLVFALTILGCLGVALVFLNGLFLHQAQLEWLCVPPFVLIYLWLDNKANQREGIETKQEAAGEVASAIITAGISTGEPEKTDVPTNEGKEGEKKGKKGGKKINQKEGEKEDSDKDGKKGNIKEGKSSATTSPTTIKKAREGPQDTKAGGNKKIEKEEGKSSATMIKSPQEPQEGTEASADIAVAPAARSAPAGLIAKKAEATGDKADNARQPEPPAPAPAASICKSKKSSGKKIVKNNGRKQGGASANRRSAFPDTANFNFNFKLTSDDDVRVDAAARLALVTMQLALLANLRGLSLFGGREKMDTRTIKDVATQTMTGHHASVSTCSTATDDATVGRDASLSTSTIANDATVDGRNTSLSLDGTTSPTDAALFDEIKKLAASLGEQLNAANVQLFQNAQELQSLQQTSAETIASQRAEIARLTAELREARAGKVDAA